MGEVNTLSELVQNLFYELSFTHFTASCSRGSQPQMTTLPIAKTCRRKVLIGSTGNGFLVSFVLVCVVFMVMSSTWAACEKTWSFSALGGNQLNPSQNHHRIILGERHQFLRFQAILGIFGAAFQLEYLGVSLLKCKTSVGAFSP
eukprot:5020399-Amphidinium_carterae.1